jgi:phosphoribosyl 1,2-cyclic phosphodiesterase
MIIKILGSSSSSNCYLLQADNGETLLIECGVDFKEVKKTLNFDISNVSGCLISHEHKDHAGYVQKLLEAGIDCYMSKGTKEALELNHHRANILSEFTKTSIGSYKVMTFKTKHDCAEPIFEGLNHIFIECNYAKDILNNNVELGIINNQLKNRTLRSHFELENVKNFLKSNDISSVRNICLLHLSDRNSDAERFKKEIEQLTDKNVVIAEKGTEIDLNLFSF